MGDLKLFLISPTERISAYDAVIGETAGFEINLNVADDKGDESITFRFETDPARISTQDYQLKGDPVEIQIQTRPKIDSEKSETYARVGRNLGAIEVVMEPAIQSA